MILQKISSAQKINNDEFIGEYKLCNQNIEYKNNLRFIKCVHQKKGDTFIAKCVPCKSEDVSLFENKFNSVSISFPFLFNLYDVFYDNAGAILYLVYDDISGSLDTYCKSRRSKNQSPGQSISEKKAIQIFLQIAEAAIWLWDNGMIHGSITPEDIVYCNNKTSKSKIFMLSGFNLSTFEHPLSERKLEKKQYLAPEIIKNENCSYSTDIWGLGLVLHEMLFGEQFYDGPNDQIIVKKIIEINYKLSNDQKKIISPNVANLLEEMIQKDPAKRISKEKFENDLKEFDEYHFVRSVLNFHNHVKIFSAAHETSSCEVAKALHRYAENLQNNSINLVQKGYYNLSMCLQQEAVEIFNFILGENATETKFALVRYAQTLIFNGFNEKAKSVCDNAIKLYEKNITENEVDLSRAYAVMGSIELSIGNNDASFKYNLKSVQARLKHYGENHRETAAVINNLGQNLSNFGNNITAKDFYKKTTQIFIKIFGRNHFETGIGYLNLGKIYLKLKNYKKALWYSRQAKNIYKKFYGADHYRSNVAENLEISILLILKNKNKKAF